MNQPIGADAIEVARMNGNVNIQGSMAVEILDLSETSKDAQMQHAETLRRFEAQTRARAVIVPTDIAEVKLKLRSMNQPITLFGEGPADRRERLKQLIASLELSSEQAAKMQHMMSEQSGGTGEEEAMELDQKKKETFYTHASEELIHLRTELAADTFQRTSLCLFFLMFNYIKSVLFCILGAHERLQNTRKIRESEALQAAEDTQVAQIYTDAKNISLGASQFADERPLTAVRVCASGGAFASSSLNPVVKVWNTETVSMATSLTGHLERVTSLAWHPDAYVRDGPALLASTSADSTCLIWDARKGDQRPGKDGMDVSDGARTEEEALKIAAAASAASSTASANSSAVLKLQGHEGVVAKCEFHPNGKYIGTTGHDFTWRLWDVETGKRVSKYPGRHVTRAERNAGGDKKIHANGHSNEVLAIACTTDGKYVASAGRDSTIRLWDVRSNELLDTFKGHRDIISTLTFQDYTHTLYSGSHDRTVKIWNMTERMYVDTLFGHQAEVTSVSCLRKERVVR